MAKSLCHTEQDFCGGVDKKRAALSEAEQWYDSSGAVSV